MSGWVLHVWRQDRGASLRALRLVGPSEDHRWTAPVQDGAEGVASAAGAAGDWIAGALRDAGARGELDAVCIDTEGAVCSFVSAPSGERPIIRALVAGDDADSFGDDEGESGWSRFPEADAGLEVDVVGVPAPSDEGGKARTAVLAVPASAVQVLLQALDARGVRVGRSVSLWHAAAGAFDPAAKRARGELDADPSVTAVVMPDDERGVLVWAWSLGGRLLASGDLRVRTGNADNGGAARSDALARAGDREPADAKRCRPGEHDAGRIVSDWVAFAVQTGRTPARVVVAGLDVERDAGSRAFASKLASAWPDAPLDAMDHEDALGVAIRSLADRPDAPPAPVGEDEGGRAIVGLSRRPVRWHRAAYTATAVLLVLLALGIGAGAWRLGSAASAFEDRERLLRADERRLLESVDSELVLSPFPEQELGDRVASARLAISPDADNTAPPEVMPLLERLTLAIGTTGITLTSIEVSAVDLTVRTEVSDVAEHEALNAAVRDLTRDEVIWREPQIQPSRDRLRLTYRGAWR
ncbi:MAG: hypothetical protein AAF356_08945 [Planctomycetota bacterium]